MRIVGGALRGLRLAPVPADAPLRPTADRAREAVFGLLEGGRFGEPVVGARVLDLFAGTGALGIEALSRGAAEAVLVEDGRVAGRLIRENLSLAGLGGRLLVTDATRLGANDEEPFGLVFMDPPYGLGLGERALRAALAGGWLLSGGLVVWEEAGVMMPVPGTRLLDRRKYGAATVTVLRVE